MGRPVAPPFGSWPLEMRAETAAAYCDEPSVEASLPAPFLDSHPLAAWVDMVRLDGRAIAAYRRIARVQNALN